MKKVILLAGTILLNLSISTLLPYSDSEPATNPVLINYFRERAVSNFTFIDPYGRKRSRASSFQIEQLAQHLARNFVRDLEKSLHDLSFEMQKLRAVHQDIKLAGDTNSEASALALWEDSLEEIENETGSLRKKLSLLMIGYKSKSDFKPRFTPDSAEECFERELGFLDQKIKQADQQIHDFLIAPTHLVGVKQLSSESFLVQLHEANQMAKELKKVTPERATTPFNGSW